MIEILKMLADHPQNEIHGSSIIDNKEFQLLTFSKHTVEALYRRGLITYEGEHQWGASYDNQGNVTHRYTNPIYRISDEGRKVLEQHR